MNASPESAAPEPAKIFHTVVVSDIHLTEAEPPHPGNPTWKRYKRAKYFVDKTFVRFLEHLEAKVQQPIELVLNGDIFDFDSVLSIPENPPYPVSWLEKKRGLSAEEAKSRFKLKVILNDHTIWVQAIREFILRGHRVIFILGNHDMEFHWRSMQQDLIAALDLPTEFKAGFRICEWFYISNGDTLIEHGNQYDDYCLCQNPINPLIRKGNKVYVRLPFGNLAGKYIMNGIGLMNPHADSSFIKNSFFEYFVFFLRYVVRTQPLLFWTWFWSAIATLVISLVEGFEPPLVDPLTLERRVKEIARKANASPRIVRNLRAIHVHPAIYNPYKILKELWLDRAFLLVVVFFISFEIFTVVNLFSPISFWWFILMFLLILPFYVFYARSVEAELAKAYKTMMSKVSLSSRIAKVKRVVFGHTHIEMHSVIDGVEVLNTGTWSAAYEDAECTKPMGRKCFAWIKPKADATLAGDVPRVAELYEWQDPNVQLITPNLPEK